MRNILSVWCGAFTCLAVACSGSGGPSKAPETRVLGAGAQSSLAALTIDPADLAKATLRFDPAPAELADLEADDLIVSSPIKTSAPYGFLYRVVTVDRSSGALVVTGEQAPLSDVIKEGDIALDRKITAADIDMASSTGPRSMPLALPAQRPGTVSINWPRIDFADVQLLCDDPTPCSMSGHITLPDPQFSSDISFDFGGLQRFMFRVAVDAEISLDLHGRFATPSVGKDVVIYRLYLTPIDIQVGPFPVVLVPRIDFKLGAKAAIALDVDTATFSAEAHLVTGIDHVRGQPDQDLSAASASGSASANRTAQTTVIADLYTRVDAGIYIYNGFGPYTYFEQGPRLDFATPRHPFFQLGYRVAMGMGGRFDFIDPSILNLIDVSGAFFDHVFPLYSSPDTAPLITSFTPGADLSLNPADSLALAVDGYDLEDGPVTDGMVRWTSSIDGAIGTGKSLSRSFIDGGPGTRTVIATVTDSDLQASTRSVNVTLPAAAPVAVIDQPLSTSTPFVGVATTVSAHVSSAYYPAEDFCTVPGATFSWGSSNKTDSFAGTTASSCGGTVTFGSAGARTLTFNATDRFGQNTVAQVTVTAAAPPSCFVAITVTPSGQLITNEGALTTVQLDATVAPGCPAPTSHHFTVRSHLPGGEIREHIYGEGTSVSFEPVATRTTIDPSVMLMSDTTFELQPIDIVYDYAWSGGTTSAITTVQYQYSPG